MNLGVQDFLLALLVIFSLLYYYKISKFNYWKKRGVLGPHPSFIFGNFTRVFFKQSTIAQTLEEIYKKWKRHSFVGIYKGNSPELLINDLDLIKNILITDFETFKGRGNSTNEDIDPLGANLFRLEGTKWKVLRTNLTPMFTTGKLKHMIKLMIECADCFETCLKSQVGKGKIIDCREEAAKYTMDVIGSCAFGINMNAISCEDSEFRKFGKKVTEPNFKVVIELIIRDISPALYKFMNFRIFPKEESEFFIQCIKQTVETRKRDKIFRNDLVNMLMEIQKNHDNKNFEFTEKLMASLAFGFFAASFETSSGTISFALYELALQPQIQEKVRQEIIKTLHKYNGEITYESINDMKYLHMIVHETLRKNTPLGVLERVACRPYTIPGTNITIEKGTKVNIPVRAIHYDPEYHTHPNVFDPERFSPDVKNNMHPMTHLPFGDGPKNCIGYRFGMLKVKLGIIKVLENFTIKPCQLTSCPYAIDKGRSFLTALGGINLLLEPLNKN